MLGFRVSPVLTLGMHGSFRTDRIPEERVFAKGRILPKKTILAKTQPRKQPHPSSGAKCIASEAAAEGSRTRRRTCLPVSRVGLLQLLKTPSLARPLEWRLRAGRLSLSIAMADSTCNRNQDPRQYQRGRAGVTPVLGRLFMPGNARPKSSIREAFLGRRGPQGCSEG